MAIQIKRRQLAGDPIDSTLHPIIDRIYRGRGVTTTEQVSTQAKHLLHFRDLNGIQHAVSLIIDAMRANKRIVIVGDFDADGATSTALCIIALKAMGVTNVSYLVPNRFDLGYGLSPGIVDVAHAGKAELIITVDSGIACVPGVSRANALNIPVIVTDHHLPPAQLPNADAIVNPNLQDCEFPSKHLAGVGVAFYLLSALRTELMQQDWFTQQGIQPPSMAQWLDIVAVGTVADVVPMDSNNRILVHQGLQRIRAGKCRPGIQAMLDIANRHAENLTAADLGFVIGPRLNAAGRLEDMSQGIECLLAEDVYQAREIAAHLDSLNQQRKQIEKDMKQDAERLVSELETGDENSLPSALVLYQDDFHQGVIGIVAGRIKDKFNRPVIAFAAQEAGLIKGSARSISGVHIRDALETVNQSNPDLIEKFGGHAMAAGLTIKLDGLAKFTAAFSEVIQTLCADLPNEQVLLTDGALSTRELSLDFAFVLNQAGPFGQNFPAPSFDDVFTVVNQRIVGENHLKLVLRHQEGNEFDAIAFNIDTQIWPNTSIQRVHVVYRPDINIFRGRKQLQLMIEHIEAVN